MRVIPVFVLAVALSLFGALHSNAAEKATSGGALPAALKAVGATPSQVLTTAQAERVRGQRIWFGPRAIQSGTSSGVSAGLRAIGYR